MNLSIAVTGASSQIGYFLLPQLLAKADRVIAYARQSMPPWMQAASTLDWIIADSDENNVALSAEPAQHFISLGPLSVANQCLAGMPQVKSVIAISTTSLLSKRKSQDESERMQMHAISAAENALIHECEKRGVRLVVLRPTLIYGAGLDNNVCFIARFVERYGFFPVAGKAAGKRQPVHAADIADLCMDLLEHDADGIYSLTGGSTLSFEDMTTNVVETVGKGRVVHLPLPLLSIGLSIAHTLGQFRHMNTAMFKRQQVDLIFDDRPARRELAWSPREFRLDKAALSPPETYPDQ